MLLLLLLLLLLFARDQRSGGARGEASGPALVAGHCPSERGGPRGEELERRAAEGRPIGGQGRN